MKNKIKYILPKILAVITGHKRDKVEIKWTRGCWTHNIFRAYEMFFWRRSGIRAEMSKDLNSKIIACHSWESVFVFIEENIRQAVKDFSFKKLIPIRIWIPILNTQAGPVFASPYLFAVAYDTSTNGGFSGGPTLTISHTITGSNPYLTVAQLGPVSGTNDVTSMTWNTTEVMATAAGIRIPSDRFTALWHLMAPSTGAHSVVATFTGGFIVASSSSYSGVAQTGQPDASNTNSGTGTATLTVSVTTIADNCWLIGSLANAASSEGAGTGTTARQNPAGAGYGLFDSNGPKSPAGSYSLQGTSPTTSVAGAVISISPYVAAASASPGLFPFFNY